MHRKLIELELAIHRCRAEATNDPVSPCHKICGFSSYGADEPQLIVSQAADLPANVEAITVGINPRWTKHPTMHPSGRPLGQLRGPAAFDTYKRTILSRLPAGLVCAHLELVQCGTPNGRQVGSIIGRCREKFFDKATEHLKPRLIIAIGKYASEHLYWHSTDSGQRHQPWDGIRKRHATRDIARIGNHQCPLVFVLQPSSYVSIEKRRVAAEAISQAYSGGQS